MENPREEQPISPSNENTHMIMKGKRTKRHRVLLTMVSSSAGEEEEDRLPPSPTSSTQIYESTEEDEDMANCLIMLAQSGENSSSKRSSETAMKAGLYSYECKTCSRCFPSFQALGGHRASHKKPKASQEDKLMTMVMVEDGGFSLFQQQQQQQPVKSSNNNNSNKSNRVHECSICGSEFSSGQALGGHMRRHRIIPENQELKKPRNVLSLDLNLPAPEDEHDSYSKFINDGFSSKQPLVFTAAALVDCHY